MSAGTAFTTIRTEGAILPPDILNRIAAGDKDLGGLTEGAYHLTGEKFGEATNRAWNRLQSAWLNFQTARQNLPPEDAGTTITRERWLLPLFQLLDYGRLQISKAHEIGGKTYAVSHAWQNVPIHLVGCNVDLDSRLRGTSPHSLLQEFLNRSEGQLWGIVSNGLGLRLLRDNISLTRQAYVEFDLEAMMAGEAYPDFVLLWLLLHQSRFEGERPELAWIEKWSLAARTEGVRVLDGLRDGVQRAIESLGQGALAHAANISLREALRNGSLDKQDYYRELLRLVYRLIFMFVAEDRSLLLDPAASTEARERYTKFYAVARIRRLAISKAGSRHDDLFRTLKFVMVKLSSDGCPELALPALGSFLFSPRSMPNLDLCQIANRDLLVAVRSLAVMQTKHGRREVDYRNLGAEELGSVYESLLELHPAVDASAAVFELKVAAGSERKKTGSYYTPTSLISCLLDSALDPVVADATRQHNPEQEILRLKIVDPACGSGHFLIAAAHRVAKRLAAVRTGDEEPAPEAVRRGLRDVIAHCIYGVDINPMAVELCKVSLWMEALEPGKPLSFLEHRIQVGNSLLGTTPRLLEGGIPDEAFQPIEGDIKEACTKWRKVNKSERKSAALGAAKFAFEDYPWLKLGHFGQSLMQLDNLGDDTIAKVRAKAEIYEEAVRSSDYMDSRLLADAWCAAFVWRKDSLYDYPITEEVFRRIERNPHGCSKGMRDEIERLARDYRFFHWHIAFPDVFHITAHEANQKGRTATRAGGFDVVLGNPPWETIKLQDKEWFAERYPAVAEAPNTAARDRMIAALEQQEPFLYAEYIRASRLAAGSAHLITGGAAYPLCSSGDLNTFGLFAELSRSIVSNCGRVGCILPTGIVTDDPYKYFFQDIVSTRSLISVFDFENQKPHFAAVKRTMKFCLFTSFGRGSSLACEAPEFLFFGYDTPDLADNERRFKLPADTIARVNPNTKTCPVFRSRRDADLTGCIHNYHEVLVREGDEAGNPWRVDFTTLFHMSGDSGLFRFFDQVEGTAKALAGSWLIVDGQRWAPLFEQNLFHMYDHRFSSYGRVDENPSSTVSEYLSEALHTKPTAVSVPRYWLPERQLQERWTQKGLSRSWSLAFRQSARNVDSRTGIFCVLPKVASGHSVHISEIALEDARMSGARLAEWNSFAWDYLFRQSLGGNNTSFFVVKQVASIAPTLINSLCAWDTCSCLDWLVPRVLELTYTAWDLAAFAKDCGYAGPPFRWDEERRFLLRCELDAAFFRFYLRANPDGNWHSETGETTESMRQVKNSFPSARDAAIYIMGTFPIVRRKDEETWSDYRTKRVILEIYDAMTDSEKSGVAYQTRLDPPPADPRVAHPLAPGNSLSEQ